MSWYVTEFDPVGGNMFCYASNNTDPFCSEWGYSNVKTLLQFGCIMSRLVDKTCRYG